MHSKANIKGIWNFAPVKMRVPEDVKIVNEDLSVGLSRLSYYITGKQLSFPIVKLDAFPQQWYAFVSGMRYYLLKDGVLIFYNFYLFFIEKL